MWKIEEYKEAIETINYGLYYFRKNLTEDEVKRLEESKHYLEGEMKQRILESYGHPEIWQRG